MIDFSINWLAWLAVVVGSMILGFLWYSKVLFGRAWQAAIGKSDEDMKAKAGGAMAVMVILSLVMAFILANVMGWIGETSFGAGMMAGFWLWLGFTFAPGMTNAKFVQRNLKAAWIEQIYYGVVFIVGGGVLTAWV